MRTTFSPPKNALPVMRPTSVNTSAPTASPPHFVRALDSGGADGNATDGCTGRNSCDGRGDKETGEIGRGAAGGSTGRRAVFVTSLTGVERAEGGVCGAALTVS